MNLCAFVTNFYHQHCFIKSHVFADYKSIHTSNFTAFFKNLAPTGYRAKDYIQHIFQHKTSLNTGTTTSSNHNKNSYFST